MDKPKPASNLRMEKLLAIQRTFGTAISETGDLETALTHLEKALFQIENIDTLAFYLLDDAARELKLTYHRGLSPGFVESASRFPASSRMVALVNGKKPCYGLYPHIAPSKHDVRLREGLQSAGIIPIIHDDKVVGMMMIASHVQPPISRGARDVIEAAATQIGSFVSRLKIENALKVSEERFRKIFEGANDCLIYLEASGEISDINEKAVALFGGEKSDYIGRIFTQLDIVLPEDIPRIKAAFSEIFSGQESHHNIRVKKHDGEVIVLECSTSLIQLDGTITGATVIARDITDRLKAERAVQESEEKYRKQFEQSLDAIIIADTETGEILDVNRAACELIGREPGELIGQPQHILHPPQNHDGTLSNTFRQHRDAAEGETIQTQVITRDGTIKDVEIKATRFELKGRAVLQGIFHDITMRKRAEKNISQRLEFEKTVSAISSLFVGVYNIDASIDDSLRHMGRLSGASRAYLFMFRDTGSLVMDNTHEWCAEDVASQKEFLQNLPCDLFPWWLEKLKNREAIIIKNLAELPPEARSEQEILEQQNIKSLIVLPMHIRGELAGYIGFDNILRANAWSDYDLALLRISSEMIGNALERERAEEETLLREERLLQVQKMEAIGNLAGGVAHDFNNLLTTIKGYGELLLNELHPDDPRYTNASEILKAAHRASLFTRQLLAFSRRQMLQPQTLDLNMVITNMEKMLKPMIGETVQLVTALDPDLKKVQVDQGQMEQVIMNLAVNARDAMPKGGRLTVRTESVTLTEAQCARIPEARPGEFVCLSIADSGVGMHKEVMQHIFEPFFTTKQVGKGTGIGLSVIYGIIKQHKGWINVFSRPDLGSTFKVYLPAASDAQPAITAGEAIPRRQLPGQGERILCVEDEEGVRKFAVDALSQNGYLVFPASTAREAIDIFTKENGSFTMVFSDVVLPDINGVELVSHLLELKPDLKVLMTGGYTGEQSQTETIRQKGFRFLPKPYALPDLLHTVRNVIETATTQ